MLAYLMTLSSEFIGYLCRATSFSRIFLFGNKCDLQHLRTVRKTQRVTKRCRLSWRTNSALVYEPKCGRGGRVVAGSQPMSKANFGDVTPYLTYRKPIRTLTKPSEF